jgi:hypothetical protein
VPQIPNKALQPVLQWSTVEPHQPYCEQQFPNEDPLQMNLEVPPQVPSFETTPVGVETGPVEVATVGVAATEEDAAVMMLELPSPAQLPKGVWHPTLQWSTVFPHHPYCEQHWPSGNPIQVKPEVPPQDPSWETAVGEVIGAVAVVEVGIAEDRADEVRLPEELLYQLASGSPMHSPMVTARKPLDWMVSSMKPVRFWAVCWWMSCAIANHSLFAGSLGPTAFWKLFFAFWILSGVTLL